MDAIGYTLAEARERHAAPHVVVQIKPAASTSCDESSGEEALDDFASPPVPTTARTFLERVVDAVFGKVSDPRTDNIIELFEGPGDETDEFTLMMLRRNEAEERVMPVDDDDGVEVRYVRLEADAHVEYAVVSTDYDDVTSAYGGGGTTTATEEEDIETAGIMSGSRDLILAAEPTDVMRVQRGSALHAFCVQCEVYRNDEALASESLIQHNDVHGNVFVAAAPADTDEFSAYYYWAYALHSVAMGNFDEILARIAQAPSAEARAALISEARKIILNYENSSAREHARPHCTPK